MVEKKFLFNKETKGRIFIFWVGLSLVKDGQTLHFATNKGRNVSLDPSSPNVLKN
jgi:hypothetical protein